jgi:hypothetical protein
MAFVRANRMTLMISSSKMPCRRRRIMYLVIGFPFAQGIKSREQGILKSLVPFIAILSTPLHPTRSSSRRGLHQRPLRSWPAC